ncbi:MAG: ribosome biogenesis GTPase Der, partial [Blastopirellula sp. JB062]
GKNVKALLNHAQMLFKQSRERISTGELNRIVRFAIERTPPPLYKLRRPKIYFATQIGAQPPTIVLKCNSPKAFSDGYRRYLLSMLRDHVSFSEVPIKLYLHRRQEAEAKAAGSGEDAPAAPDSDSGDAAVSDMLNDSHDD